jgi:hypothetical protein
MSTEGGANREDDQGGEAPWWRNPVWWQGLRSWAALVAVLIVPLVLLYLLPYLSASAVADYERPRPGLSRCRAKEDHWKPLGIEPSATSDRRKAGATDGAGSAKTKPVREPITLVPKEGDGSAVFAFERSRGAMGRRVLFETSRRVPPPRGSIDLYAGDWLRTSETGRIYDQNIRYQVEIVRGLMAVRLCVSPIDVDPGEYTGHVYLVDERFEPVDIPVTVTIQYNGWHVIVMVLWVAFVAAVVFKWIGAQRAVNVEIQARRIPRDLRIWAGKRFLGLAAGAVAVAAIFWSQYWSVHEWGSSPRQLFALMGAAFAATVTTVSAEEVAKPTAQTGLPRELDPERQRRRGSSGDREPTGSEGAGRGRAVNRTRS